MAHHFSVPLAFEFITERRSWRFTQFAIAGEERDFTPPPANFPGTDIPIPPLIAPIQDTSRDILIRLLEKEKLDGAYPHSRYLYKALGREESAFMGGLDKLRRSGKGIPEGLDDVIVSDPREAPSSRKADPWAMREDFMRLEESSSALAGFLNRWGTWDTSTALVTARVPWRELLMPRLGEGPSFVLPYSVWKQREVYRAGMLGPAGAWLSTRASLGMTRRRSQFPYLGITDASCSRAIETTITLDHLRRVKHRLCERVDCNNIFQVDSDHGKMYCEQYCGHLVSVRRKRAAIKKAAQSAKRKRV